MPQPTPARTTDRDRLRSRPSSVSRSVSADNAPVLFRFPAIAVAEAAVPGPTLQSSVVPPIVERSSVAGQSDTVASMESVCCSAGSEVVEQRSNSNSNSNSKSDIVQPQAIVVQPAAAPAPERSWWDHWSSGVVLILLIIALVAASILALNDGSKSPSDQLAGQSLTTAIDEFDLSNITIPEIVISQSGDSAKQVAVAAASQVGSGDTAQNLDQESQSAELLNSSKLASDQHGSESRATMAETSKPETKPNTSFTLESQLESPSRRTEAKGSLELTGLDSTSANAGGSNEAEVATKSEPASSASGRVPQAVLELPAEANLLAETPGLASSSSATSAATPLATLALPEAATPLPLFDPNKTPASGVRTNLSAEKPVTSLTSGSPNLNPNAEVQNTQAASQPAQMVPGASPTLYDGAARPAGAVASSGPVDTSLPSFDTILASAAIPSAPASGNSSLGSVQGAGAPQLPTAVQPMAVTGTVAGRGQPAYVSTATPDSPDPALIKAYLPYIQMTQASNGVLSNRYPAATGQPTVSQQSSQPSVQPSVQSGGIGFTLGN